MSQFAVLHNGAFLFNCFAVKWLGKYRRVVKEISGVVISRQHRAFSLGKFYSKWMNSHPVVNTLHM